MCLLYALHLQQLQFAVLVLSPGQLHCTVIVEVMLGTHEVAVAGGTGDHYELSHWTARSTQRKHFTADGRLKWLR